eukprot:scaffold630_cov174-Amphora_coffeaeformis.AAC.11
MSVRVYGMGYECRRDSENSPPSNDRRMIRRVGVTRVTPDVSHLRDVIQTLGIRTSFPIQGAADDGASCPPCHYEKKGSRAHEEAVQMILE